LSLVFILVPGLRPNMRNKGVTLKQTYTFPSTAIDRLSMDPVQKGRKFPGTQTHMSSFQSAEFPKAVTPTTFAL